MTPCPRAHEEKDEMREPRTTPRAWDDAALECCFRSARLQGGANPGCGRRRTRQRGPGGDIRRAIGRGDHAGGKRRRAVGISGAWLRAIDRRRKAARCRAVRTVQAVATARRANRRADKAGPVVATGPLPTAARSTGQGATAAVTDRPTDLALCSAGRAAASANRCPLREITAARALLHPHALPIHAERDLLAFAPFASGRLPHDTACHSNQRRERRPAGRGRPARGWDLPVTLHRGLLASSRPSGSLVPQTTRRSRA